MSLAGKRILYVITKSNWGGAQRYVYDLATAATGAGAVVAVALGGRGALAEKLEAAGIPILPLGRLGRDLSLARDVGSFGELREAIAAFAPDLVHLNSSKAGGLGALAARLAGVERIVFTAHGWPFKEERGLLWRLFALLGSYATALLSHAVIVVSKADLALGERMPLCARKMHLIYNGIDRSALLGGGEIIRRAFPAGARILGTIGELTENKNQRALIERARHDPSLFVAIVGEGELRGALAAKIEEYGLGERVKLFGFLPAGEVLKGFDAFALPSKKEGLPYVLLEARAAGLPIEANRVGGVGEALELPLAEFSLERMLAKTFALYSS